MPMPVDLTITNVLLAVLATVGVIQAALFIGAGILALRAYRAFMSLAAGIEARHVAPAMGIVTRILEDISAMTAAMKHGTARVDEAVSNAVRGAEHVTGHLQQTLRRRVDALTGISRGLRLAARTLLHPSASGTR